MKTFINQFGTRCDVRTGRPVDLINAPDRRQFHDGAVRVKEVENYDGRAAESARQEWYRTGHAMKRYLGSE